MIFQVSRAHRCQHRNHLPTCNSLHQSPAPPVQAQVLIQAAGDCIPPIPAGAHIRKLCDNSLRGVSIIHSGVYADVRKPRF